MLKPHLLVILLLFLLLGRQNGSAAQTTTMHTNVPRKPLRLQNPIQDKSFYFLSLLVSTPNVVRSFSNDSEMASLTRRKLTDESACNPDPSHCINSAIFTPEEVTEANTRLLKDLSKVPEARSKIVTLMRRSGLFELYAPLADDEMISKAWTDAARGINQIVGVYANKQLARYPKIDSPDLDIHSAAVKKALSDFSLRLAAINSDTNMSKDELWFQPSLQLAMLLLELNKRNEAERFEPLERGENAPALARLAHVQWSKYRYSVIIVPGLGPEEPGVALDPGGFRRIALASKRYREGLAPFILVSGGNVHPSQTPFCEAIEMKKALVRELGIPAESILVEPHARHTTTNLRNASRLLYRYGFPLDKPALITTDEAQTRSILSPEFKRRNLEELGYLPYRNLRSISSTDTAFDVEVDSLQANSLDPLDP